MIHSFLLIGQSNMAGRGDISEAADIDTSHIKVLRNGRWQGMFRPVNPDRSFSGVCLAESFAERYAATYGVDAGLIPCADGGTSLEQWKEGGLLFDNAVNNARLAARTSVIAGILWHQGEADCGVELYSTYKERFMKMLAALRREECLANVPVLVGGLGDYLPKRAEIVHPEVDKYQNFAQVNSQLEQIAAEDENIGYVSAAGLKPKSDCLHFNSASLYEFGIRYFEEYRKLRDESLFNIAVAEDDSKRTAMELL